MREDGRTLKGHAMILELGSRVQEIARRLLWGQPHTQIMSDLQLTYRQLRYVLQSDQFKTTYKALEKELYSKLDAEFSDEMVTVSKRAREESVNAIEKLVTLMKSSASEGLQRDCANDVLKYAGVNRDKVTISAPTISPNQINILVQAAREDDERRSGNGAA